MASVKNSLVPTLKELIGSINNSDLSFSSLPFLSLKEDLVSRAFDKKRFVDTLTEIHSGQSRINKTDIHNVLNRRIIDLKSLEKDIKLDPEDSISSARIAPNNQVRSSRRRTDSPPTAITGAILSDNSPGSFLETTESSNLLIKSTRYNNSGFQVVENDSVSIDQCTENSLVSQTIEGINDSKALSTIRTTSISRRVADIERARKKRIQLHSPKVTTRQTRNNSNRGQKKRTLSGKKEIYHLESTTARSTTPESNQITSFTESSMIPDSIATKSMSKVQLRSDKETTMNNEDGEFNAVTTTSPSMFATTYLISTIELSGAPTTERIPTTDVDITTIREMIPNGDSGIVSTTESISTATEVTEDSITIHSAEEYLKLGITTSSSVMKERDQEEGSGFLMTETEIVLDEEISEVWDKDLDFINNQLAETTTNFLEIAISESDAEKDLKFDLDSPFTRTYASEENTRGMETSTSNSENYLESSLSPAVFYTESYSNIKDSTSLPEIFITESFTTTLDCTSGLLFSNSEALSTEGSTMFDDLNLNYLKITTDRNLPKNNELIESDFVVNSKEETLSPPIITYNSHIDFQEFNDTKFNPTLDSKDNVKYGEVINFSTTVLNPAEKHQNRNPITTAELKLVPSTEKTLSISEISRENLNDTFSSVSTKSRNDQHHLKRKIVDQLDTSQIESGKTETMQITQMRNGNGASAPRIISSSNLLSGKENSTRKGSPVVYRGSKKYVSRKMLSVTERIQPKQQGNIISRKMKEILQERPDHLKTGNSDSELNIREEQSDRKNKVPEPEVKISDDLDQVGSEVNIYRKSIDGSTSRRTGSLYYREPAQIRSRANNLLSRTTQASLKKFSDSNAQSQSINYENSAPAPKYKSVPVDDLTILQKPLVKSKDQRVALDHEAHESILEDSNITDTTTSTTEPGNSQFRTNSQRKISTTESPKILTTVPGSKRRQDQNYSNRVVPQSLPEKPRRPAIIDYDYYENEDMRFVQKSVLNDKLYINIRGKIQCLDQGNFPHPISCKKFIICARMVDGLIIGTQYTCPDKLSFDPIGGICNWSAGLGCKE